MFGRPAGQESHKEEPGIRPASSSQNAEPCPSNCYGAWVRARAFFASACVSIACSPAVDADSGSASSEGTGSSGLEVSTTAETTVLGTDSVSSSPSTSDPGPLDVFVQDLPAPPQECWRLDVLFEAPLGSAVVIVDQDGDGADEIWLQAINGRSPGESSPIFGLDRSGVVVAEQPFSGVLRGLGDINGDGYLDLNVLGLGGGPPVTGYLQASRPLSFGPSLVELQIPFDLFRTDGFFDRTQDGVADALRLVEPGSLEFLLGDGMAGFEVTASIPFANAPGIRVLPVAGTQDQVVVHTAAVIGGGQPEDCQSQDYSVIEVGPGGTLSLVGQSATDLALGQFYRARVPQPGSAADVFVGTCSPGATTFDVRRLTPSADSGSLVETPVVTGKAWAGVFDYDGDGILDVAYSDEPGGDISVLNRGLDGEVVTLATGIEGGPVPYNRVQAGDLDGDGREELLLAGGAVGSGAHAYELLYLGPCE